MLKRPTNEQLLADIRRRLDQGFTAATAERVKSLASKSSDPELLRGMAMALADAIINPKPRKTGRPKKQIEPRLEGVIDLDAMPALTEKEQHERMQTFLQTMSIVWEIRDAHASKGTPLRTLCELHGIGVDTYYKWFPPHS